MKTIEDILLNEFTISSYKIIATFDDVMVLGVNDAIDYWVITSNKYWIDNQFDLFEKLTNGMKSFNFMEKNLSLLLLYNTEFDEFDKIDVVRIENDKSYFKKYVLKYSNKAASNLIGVMNERSVHSISELMMDGNIFTSARDSGDSINEYSLIYAISHKLAFIPIIAQGEAYTSNNFSFSSDTISKIFDWVNDAPDDDHRIDSYIQNLLKEDNNE